MLLLSIKGKPLLASFYAILVERQENRTCTSKEVMKGYSEGHFYLLFIFPLIEAESGWVGVHEVGRAVRKRG